MSEYRMAASHPILIVEDSPEDYETTKRAFLKGGLSNPIVHCCDGDDALDYLFHRGPYANDDRSPLPAIMMLDLNLPGTDGREVLETIKRDDELKCIPVIILTTSSDDRDIQRCYEAGANSYVQKPVNLAGFMEAVQRIKDYWFEVVILPKKVTSGIGL